MSEKTTTNIPAGWLSVKEAQQRLGRSQMCVNNMIHRGLLKAVRIEEAKGNPWRIDPTSVETYRQARKEKEDRQRAREESPRSAMVERLQAQGWLTTNDLVKRFGVTRQRIHQLLHSGRIPGATTVGKHFWMFPPNTTSAVLQTTSAVLQAREESSFSATVERLQAQGWLTTNDLVKRLVITRQRIHKLLQSGRIVGATMVGKRFWMCPPNTTIANVAPRDEWLDAAPPDGWMTVGDVVIRLGISYANVCLLLRKGHLKGTRLKGGTRGRRWIVDPASLESFQHASTKAKQKQVQARQAKEVVAEEANERRTRRQRLKDEGWETSKEIAERLGVPYGRMLGWIQDKRFPNAVQVGNRWMFPAGSVPVELKSSRQQIELDPGCLTTQEAAKRLGLTNGSVLRYVAVGRLKATFDGWRWIYRIQDVDAFKAIRSTWG